MQENYTELIKSGLDICLVWLYNSLAVNSQISLSRLKIQGSVNCNKYQCREPSLFRLKSFLYPKPIKMATVCDSNMKED